MKLKVRLKGLCCANCAAKIEERLAKAEGVEEVNVSFILQKMTLSADDSRVDEIKAVIEKTVHKIEPDVEIEYI